VSEHRIPAVVGPLTAAQIAEQMATGHSVFSPSAAEMTMTCEESLVLNVEADDHATWEAAEGTVAHSCGEHWLKTGERPDQWIGVTEIVGDFEITIDEEMLDFVYDYVEWCEDTKMQAEHYLIEGHVDISPLTPIPGQGGTGDFIAFRWQWMRIIDLKYGKDPVFARGNKQLRIYALGVFYEWDWLYNFQTIEICIAQPRVAGGMTSWTVTREELLAFADEAKAAWARSWQPRHLMTRTPSTKGCRWCRVKGTCPASYLFLAEETDVFENYEEIDAKNAMIEVVPMNITYERMMGANDKILDEFEPSPFPTMPSVPALSTLALSKLLRYRKMMEGFFNSVNAELLSRAISREEELLWWKIVESRTRRKLVEDEDWIISQLEAKGLKRRDLFVTKMKSPAELERTLHTKLKMTLGAAKKLLDEGGFTVKPPGQKTLAAVDDPRLAAPKDGDVFENYDLVDDDDI
jgi:hypothetical protein